MELPPILSVSIAQACKMSGVGRTTIYATIKRGDLKAVKVGRRTLIPLSSLTAWVNNLKSVDNNTVSLRGGKR